MVFKKNSMEKRLRKVERQSRLNRAEMKTIQLSIETTIASNTLAVSRLTQVQQGSNIGERIGDKIRLWRAETRGIGHNELDYYYILAKTDETPTIGSFGTVHGAFLLDSENTNKYSEIRYYKNLAHSGSGDNSPMRWSAKFRGKVFRFNGTSTTTGQNNLFLVIINRSGSSKSVDLSSRIWFTDP